MSTGGGLVSPHDIKGLRAIALIPVLAGTAPSLDGSCQRRSYSSPELGKRRFIRNRLTFQQVSHRLQYWKEGDMIGIEPQFGERIPVCLTRASWLVRAQP